MATELGVAYLSLSIESAGVAKDTKKALGEIEGVADSVGKKAGTSLGSKIASGLKVGTAAVSGLIAAIGGIALTGGISRALAIEDAQAKLRGLGHSTETVQTIMDNALASVKGTAFGLGDAAGLAATLVASGIKPGEQLEATLKRVADSATIAGSDLSDMGLIWGKAAAKGKIDGEIVNQLLERQIPIYDILGSQIGKNAADVAKMVSDGKIDFQTFSDAMNTYLGGAALKSGETFRGALANVRAALGRLGAAVATPALESLKGVFNSAIPAIDSATAALTPLIDSLANKLAPVLQTATDNVSAFITNIDFGKVIEQAKNFSGVLLPLAGVFVAFSGSGLTSAFPILAKVLPTITGPMGLLLGAITAVVAASPELRSALGGALEALSPVVDSLGAAFGPVATSITELAGALGTALAGALVGITPALQSVADILSLGLQVAAGALGDILDNVVVPALTAVGDWMANNADVVSAMALAIGAGVLAWKAYTAATDLWAARTKIATAIQAAWNVVMSANPITIVVAAIAALVAGLVYFFTQTETGKKLWQGFVSWLGDAWNWLKDTASKVWDAVTGFFTGAWDKIKGVWDTVSTFFSDVWANVQAAAQPAIDWWQANVAPVFTAFGELIGAVFGLVADGAMFLWNSALKPVLSWISSAWQTLWSVVQTAWNAYGVPVMGAIQTVIGVVQTAWGIVWDAVKAGFDTVWNAIKSTWETVGAVVFDAIGIYLGVLQTVWSTIWGAIQTVAEGVWNGIKITIETVLGVIRGIIETVTNLIKGDWSGAWDSIKGVIDTVWGGIQRGVENAINTVRDTVAGIKDKVLGALESAGDWLVDTGKKLIEGFWNGISDKVSWLKDKITGIGSGVIDTVKGVFGIHSPSRVFMEIGDFNMQGLKLGMEDGYADVRRSVQSIGADLPNRITPNTGDLRVNTDGKPLVQQTINPQPGMSEEQIGTSAGRALAVAMQGVNL